MRYYTLIDADGKRRLTAEAREGTLTDLTALRPSLTDLADLARAAWLAGQSIDALARRIIGDGGGPPPSTAWRTR